MKEKLHGLLPSYARCFPSVNWNHQVWFAGLFWCVGGWLCVGREGCESVCVCVCGVGVGGEGDGGSVFFREQQLAAELRNEDSLVP